MSTSGQASLQQPLFAFYLLLNNIPKVIAWSVTQNYFLMIQQLTVLLGLSSLSSIAKNKQVLRQWIYDQVLAFLLCDSSATLWVILCSGATIAFLLEQWTPGSRPGWWGPVALMEKMYDQGELGKTSLLCISLNPHGQGWEKVVSKLRQNFLPLWCLGIWWTSQL